MNTKTTKSFLALLCTVALGSLPLMGCGEVDQRADCASICTRYEDCFDSEYDSSACVDRCESEGDSDERFVDRADQCEACIDDIACSESFVCVDECAGIVP
jgi:hypothetical protein